MIGKGTKVWKQELSNISDKATIGENCVLHSHIWIGDDVKIGNNVKIQAFSFIPNGVEIEDNCFIGPRTTFTNDKYPPSGKVYKTLIKQGASIGASTTIICGVVIGSNSKIGAGSLITKDIPDNAIAYGVPAKVKGSL